MRRLRYQRDKLAIRLRYWKRRVRGEIAFWLMRQANKVETSAVQKVSFEIAYKLPEERLGITVGSKSEMQHTRRRTSHV
jgi:hypothetical protein